MIAVDTSALVAIARAEPDHQRLSSTLSDKGAVVGAPSLLKTKMVLSADPVATGELLDSFVRSGSLSIVVFTPEMADTAVDAFRRYGKGRGHPARLNFGDCMSYAVAKAEGLPLLFKGDDFALTDIEPAWRP